MKWPISWSDVKDHIDNIEDGIPAEWLPGICLPVVEITTKVQHTDTGYPLNEVDSAAMEAAAKTELPIVLRMRLDGGSLLTFQMDHMFQADYGQYGYHADTYLGVFSIVYDPQANNGVGGWYMIMPYL